MPYSRKSNAFDKTIKQRLKPLPLKGLFVKRTNGDQDTAQKRNRLKLKG